MPCDCCPECSPIAETRLTLPLSNSSPPRDRCCQAASGWTGADCGCSKQAQAELATLLNQLRRTEEPGFLLGAIRIVDAACGLPNPLCQAG